MRRKRGGFLLIVLGIVLAGLVGTMVFRESQRAATAARLETIEVVVAAHDIPERTVIGPGALTVRRMLPESLPPGAAVTQNGIVGRMALTRIHTGDFIVPGKLVETEGKSGLTYALDKGTVVMTLPASDLLSTGAVKVGDSIDILVTIFPKAREGANVAAANPADLPGSTTQTTMQNLKVLGIGSVATGGKSEGVTQANLLTFAVDHQEAVWLKALKDSEGVKIELVLRAAGDDQIATTEPVTLKNIIERYQFQTP